MIDCHDHPTIASVLHYFEEIAHIPHGSGNTGPIADYLEGFAKARGLFCYRDAANNVLIRKPATPGYEQRPTIVFQGHTDMVIAKTEDCPIDPLCEGLLLYRDGDLLRARGTTLGGDDGIAIGYALAILDSTTIPHPQFEALFTSDEEIGLFGAAKFDTGMLHGKTIVNIDSDEESVFTVGCAGGVRCDTVLPVTYESTSLPTVTVKIDGLLGGHSGMEIHKGRANAILLLAELVDSLASTGAVRLASIDGGNADNAIPREATATLAVERDVRGEVEAFCRTVRERYQDTEPDPCISVCDGAVGRVMTRESEARVLDFLLQTPCGVVAMSREVEGLVETSLNPGVAATGEDGFSLSTSVRSSKEAEKNAVAERLRANAEAHGGTFSTRGAYPAWEFREQSHLCDVMCEVHRALYGTEPKKTIIHAGLECGIFAGKIEDLDCVSIGPNNFDIHTTEERLSLSSTARVWEFLLQILKKL